MKNTPDSFIRKYYSIKKIYHHPSIKMNVAVKAAAKVMAFFYLTKFIKLLSKKYHSVKLMLTQIIGLIISTS